MENTNLTIRNQQEGSLILSDKGKRIAKIVIDVNDCVGFRMPAEEIVHWAQELERLCPDRDLHKLRFLMDCFKKDELVWDKNKGIQNIFNGLKKVGLNQDRKYIILKEIW